MTFLVHGIFAVSGNSVARKFEGKVAKFRATSKDLHKEDLHQRDMAQTAETGRPNKKKWTAKNKQPDGQTKQPNLTIRLNIEVL